MENIRKTDLSEVIFKVEQRPIFIQDGKNAEQVSGRQPQLFQPQGLSKIPRFEAVVDVDRNYVFSVVGNGYKLITNEEAVKLGAECFKSVFSKTTSDGMEVFNITTPKTRSFCHIDFVHKDSVFEPWEKDKWSPFLRVTNSYNRTKLLRFDLGFCRWICANGMIFGDKSITFRYFHTREAVAKVEFKTNFGDLKKLETAFIESLHNLKRFHVPENQMLPLICKVFDVRANAEDLSRPKRSEQLFNLKSHINRLTEKYFNEMGQNGYAALNVITDFATYPKSYISPDAMVDGLQKRSGAWTDDFIEKIEDKKFDFAVYLSEYAETVKVLNFINRTN